MQGSFSLFYKYLYSIVAETRTRSIVLYCIWFVCLFQFCLSYLNCLVFIFIFIAILGPHVTVWYKICKQRCKHAIKGDSLYLVTPQVNCNMLAEVGFQAQLDMQPTRKVYSQKTLHRISSVLMFSTLNLQMRVRIVFKAMDITDTSLW